MLMIKRFSLYCGHSALVLCCALALSPWAMADGLTDLRSVLKQLQSAKPVAVNAQFTLVGSSGDHDDLIEHEGVINLRLEDGPDGLRAVYSPDLVVQHRPYLQ